MKRIMIASLLLLGLTAFAYDEATVDQSLQSNAFNTQNDSGDLLTQDPPPYEYIYGPGRTLRWYDAGANRVPKILSEGMTIEIGGRLVNEVLIRALDNRVNVQSAVATLVDGSRFDLISLTGTIRQNQQRRVRLDRRYSLRVQRLEIQATSPNLIGSRGSVQVLLGLAD